MLILRSVTEQIRFVSQFYALQEEGVCNLLRFKAHDIRRKL